MTWDAAANLPIWKPLHNPPRQNQLRLVIQTESLGSLREHLEQRPSQLTANPASLDAYYARAWALGIMLLESSDHNLRQDLRQLLDQARQPPHLPRASSMPVTTDAWWVAHFRRSLDDIDQQWQQFATYLAAMPLNP
jgi:hypothetical protein